MPKQDTAVSKTKVLKVLIIAMMDGPQRMLETAINGVIQTEAIYYRAYNLNEGYELFRQHEEELDLIVIDSLWKTTNWSNPALVMEMRQSYKGKIVAFRQREEFSHADMIKVGCDLAINRTYENMSLKPFMKLVKGLAELPSTQ